MINNGLLGNSLHYKYNIYMINNEVYLIVVLSAIVSGFSY